ncbi:hypothetical protein [Polyangium fumosum]|uniref:Uncharacterized protein n=1 Tax=Polyangium fumosum TaxID=889272 RepID=A0A4U1J7T0_9BACT|nr:hypothetical protein [Polyangium fumosum]TKD03413.1 hypothetical protein E8A74_25965 [Polyangium fumosum]
MFTGIVLVDRNQPVAMLAFRHAPTRPASPYGHHSPGPHVPPHQRHLFIQDDDEEPPPWRPSRLWDR